ncbi:hypothetical protein U1Q18_024347 [Sarracenia purpurea var. burkii]
MSTEIVVAEPINEGCSSSNSNGREYISRNPKSFTRSITSGRDHPLEPFDSEKLPVSLVSDIQRFLRVANLIEIEEPRVAYLCRFHAFEVAHNLDQNSSGRGVRQFKTSLLQRLEQDEEITIRRRKEKSDLRELNRVYRENIDYIAWVLYEVLCRVCIAAGLEINAAVAAVRDIRGIPFPEDFRKSVAFMDLFDWLQYCFGFQRGNVANQREHLILLLANTHIRKNSKQTNISKLGDQVVNELMKKFFKNYTNWCKFLRRKSNIRLPCLKQEAQQYKLLYLGLYLLIWGEAANLRFMPECLCYIFHHMAYELHAMLIGAISMITGEKVMPAYGEGSESFLNNVVSPIYRVIHKEAMKSKNGTADYSTWRNYDDLNEYFWSPDCFQIGWPMRLDHNFFNVEHPNEWKVRNGQSLSKITQEKESEQNEDGNVDVEAQTDEELGQKWLGKTNFVEVRSFWQIFRTFDRMWSFFIMSLQAMIIMASHDVESPLQVLDAAILEDVMSIFITSAILKLVQGLVLCSA